MKEAYERTLLEITEFKSEDVIVTSGEPIDPVAELPKGRFMLPIR